MRDASEQHLVRLADYTPPAWGVRRIELEFDLGIESTEVSAKLFLRRDPRQHEPLRLDGEGLQLLGIKLDGRELAKSEYSVDARGISLSCANDAGVLETRVRIDPAQNTALSGLYLSGSRENGFLLTQCEAEGFRRITFFPDRPDVLAKYTVTLRADRERFPVLLSGGDPDGAGDLPDGRHWARFVDPHPRPCYLFALVAGRLEKLERAYRTSEGRDVVLRIWAEAGAIDACHYALNALERAMRWDERAYGRNYDLSVFNVVATHDFNMGAMENKGLNIFNAKYLLADANTTTDEEYRHIEAVIAHEYFHNWSGNRVTCRDWFQLSLKEGFTVFREQHFCSDVQSAALQRIDEVAMLRRAQFPEDAGPLAHPVRPAQYAAIDNFYTATVYEKGAELVRMIAARLGREGFRRGTDLYFSRFDGRAATIEDFIACLGEANGSDLSHYLAWYSQAGTPHVRARGEYDAGARRYVLKLTQRTLPTPGQPDKSALPIPVRIAMFAQDGSRLPLQLEGENESVRERVLEFDSQERQFVFIDVESKPVLSLMRDFSAPVQLHFDSEPEELALLLRHESQGYDRWNAAQRLATAAYDAESEGAPENLALRAWLDALAEVFQADEQAIDPALLAELLTPPSEVELGARSEPLDPDRVHASHESLEGRLANRLSGGLLVRYDAMHADEKGSPDARARVRRRLKARVLSLLCRFDPAAGVARARAQYENARTMTDRLAALWSLLLTDARHAENALRNFRAHFDGNALAIDHWFGLQARVPAHDTLDRVRALSRDPAFDLRNPNRVQSLLGVFARGNPVGFHRADGESYRFLAQRLIEIDALNPQNSARLAKAFENWRSLEPRRQSAARSVLEELSERSGLSEDLGDIVRRLLADEAESDAGSPR